MFKNKCDIKMVNTCKLMLFMPAENEQVVNVTKYVAGQLYFKQIIKFNFKFNEDIKILHNSNFNDFPDTSLCNSLFNLYTTGVLMSLYNNTVSKNKEKLTRNINKSHNINPGWQTGCVFMDYVN